MEAKATWIKGNQVELETKGQAFITDVCKEENGDHCPPSAVDFLTASFAGCVAYFIAKALQNRQFEPKGLRVKVSAEYAEAPHRLGAFKVEVDLPDNLPEALQKAAQRAAEGCTIHNTFTHPPTIQFEYHPGVVKV